MSVVFDVASAFDAAFCGKTTQLIDQIGRSSPLDVNRWGSVDWADRSLFLDPCDGPTVDVGCGPGRLVGELTARGVPAVGIDVSAEAVRQTRVRGALALRRDVYATVPGEGRWDYALLADGNLGIGGDPVRLLTRLRGMLKPDGHVIAEVADEGVGFVCDRRRLRVEGRLSTHFEWATVGLDAIAGVASDAGMSVLKTRTVGGRHTATLVRDSS